MVVRHNGGGEYHGSDTSAPSQKRNVIGLQISSHTEWQRSGRWQFSSNGGGYRGSGAIYNDLHSAADLSGGGGNILTSLYALYIRSMIDTLFHLMCQAEQQRSSRWYAGRKARETITAPTSHIDRSRQPKLSIRNSQAGRHRSGRQHYHGSGINYNTATATERLKADPHCSSYNMIVFPIYMIHG